MVGIKLLPRYNSLKPSHLTCLFKANPSTPLLITPISPFSISYKNYQSNHLSPRELSSFLSSAYLIHLHQLSLVTITSKCVLNLPIWCLLKHLVALSTSPNKKATTTSFIIQKQQNQPLLIIAHRPMVKKSIFTLVSWSITTYPHKWCPLTILTTELL